MGKEYFKNLVDEEQIQLIYCRKHITDEKAYINYTIICDVNSITEDIALLEKIVATMFVTKELFSKYNIDFSYTVKSSAELDREIEDDYENAKKVLLNAEVLHCKDNYYREVIENINTTNKSRRA